ncbi:uncharacterized protein LOC126895205 isoform X2 [Daktulosphaira vitifoliae]|uniref:uncharacterized protein LOC126895205 isoform X2 n=1 Tax=Daktulosphaira vitifoliae TaxID=58002 RepID=UPI0021AAC18B|nr:uncharacterized protein LOC126895205 isoform X2 [Daktulosphaira vitifoliae]
MNGFALKTIAITLLVCVIIDRSRAETPQDINKGTSMSDKVSSFISNFKSTASEALSKIQTNTRPVQEMDATKKVEQSLSSAQGFFQDTFSKFKHALSTKPQAPINNKHDDFDEAIKAFDDYAQTTLNKKY